MNKKILALAVAAAFAVPAMASAQTVLFGQFKYEVGYIDSTTNDGNVPPRAAPALNSDHALVHSTRGTRIGIHGSEDLGGGLTGIFRFQGGLGGTANTPMSNTNWRMDEENWVGLRSGFGTVLLGRHDTAFKKAGGGQFRAFADTLAEPSLRPANDGRAEGIHYTSPDIAGFTGYLTIEPTGHKMEAYVAGGAGYRFGSFLVVGSVELSPSKVVSPVYSAGIGPDQTNWQVGGKWNFGQGDVGVLYQAINDGDDAVITVPVTFKVTPQIGLRAAVKHTDPDVGSSWTNFGLGAQYNLSRRTEAFVNLWVDDRAAQTLNGRNNLAHLPAPNRSVSQDSTQFGLGVRHSF